MVKYFDYSKVFLVENIVKLLEHIEINNHAIKLEKSKQPPFSLIYSLRLIELETLKTYIEINLANNFIWPSKFSVGIPIFFN